jgi:nucleotide-binding universal stress UspA family protein
MKTFDIKKILVPTDFSQTASNALRQAIRIAKVNKSKIKLLHIITPLYSESKQSSTKSSDDNFYINKVKKAEEELKKIVNEVEKSSDINIEYIIKLEVVIDEAICNMVKKEEVDLVIMGTYGTSGIKEFFVGSNVYKVVHHSTCPVLTIQKKSGKWWGLKNIILPIRLEISSRQKVDYAVNFARAFDATVFITGFTEDKNESKQLKIQQYVNQVENYLSKLNIKYKSTTIFAVNFTKEILAHAKKNNADLIIVMKSHPHSLDQLIKGSYSQQFVNHSTIPILSISTFSDPDMINNSYLIGDIPF